MLTHVNMGKNGSDEMGRDKEWGDGSEWAIAAAQESRQGRAGGRAYMDGEEQEARMLLGQLQGRGGRHGGWGEGVYIYTHTHTHTHTCTPTHTHTHTQTHTRTHTQTCSSA